VGSMPSLRRFAISGAEADAADVARQAVGVLGHFTCTRRFPYRSEDAQRAWRCDTCMMAGKTIDFAHTSLIGPGPG